MRFVINDREDMQVTLSQKMLFLDLYKFQKKNLYNFLINGEQHGILLKGASFGE
jgi:hypothetical protein